MNPPGPHLAARFAVILSCLVLAIIAPAASAGTLDPSFGTGGKTTTNAAANFYDTASRVLIQSDGKILAVGTSSINFLGNTGRSPMLVRYNANGTLDTTFGTGGAVSGGPGNILVSDAVIQPDGKIIVSGGIFTSAYVVPDDFAFVRFNSDGSRDNTFGTSGVVTVSFGIGFGYETAVGVAVLADGKILAAGSAREYGPTAPGAIELVRLNPNGTLDSAFGTGGKVLHSEGQAVIDAALKDMKLLPDGKFLVLGQGFVAKFNADGTYDTSFGVNGITGAPTSDQIALQADGKYILNGAPPTAPNQGESTTFDLTRYLSNGTVDTGFGANGSVRTSFRGNGGIAPAFASQIVVKSNGEIVAFGRAKPGNTNYNFALALYSASGGVIAKSLLSFGGNSPGTCGAIQPDGKLVAAGYQDGPGNDSVVAIARFTTVTNDFHPFKRNYDFNGDGRDDITTYRPDAGGGPSHWYSSSFGFPWFTFGSNGDLIAPADYDDDGVANLAVFRPSTGYWYISNNLANAGTNFRAIQWGAAGDIPVAGDYDGDNNADVAVFRPSVGAWYILKSFAGPYGVQWGVSGDVPVVGDYDGDGRADVAVYRPSTGAWYVLKSSDGQMLSYAFGAAGDRPVPADYDGDGKTDIAVFRPSDGVWYLLTSSNGGFVAQPWGTNGDTPAPGDFDGDGKTDFAVFRPTGSDGTWYIRRSSNATVQSLSWGLSADTPVPGN